MDLNIGEVIAAKRRAKAWTQEQLANAVGVSAPAVSKWETGSTYPDITLLSPIARALDTTVDALLCYQNELSPDEVSALAKRAARIYETDGFESGWNHCQNLLREYPNSIPLKFHLGSLFQNFMLMKPNLGKQDIQRYYRQSAHIYEDVLSSGLPEFSYHATLILVGFYAMLEELDRAQALLDRLPKAQVDPDLLYPSIYALRGEHDAAMKLTQENIRRYVPRISQSLSVLCAYASEHGEMDTAYAVAAINLEMTKLFGIKEAMAYPDMIKILASRGDRENALNHLEAYAKSILHFNDDYSDNPVFDRLAQAPKDTSYIKKVLAQSILIDKAYDSLKDEPRYIQIIEQLRAVTQAPTNTFCE